MPIVVLLAGVIAVPAPLLALPPSVPDIIESAQRPERPTDPPGPYVPIVRDAAGALPIPAGAPDPGVQVNVDALGLNIPGDAANEPSIAVDPTAPNRIAIGWRQFDTVLSSFRQAGWGFSDDGGRTWTFPGVIEPGIFRSDPVLDFDADGNFFYMSLTTETGDFTCDLFKSTDGGATWDEGTFAFGGDKEWIGVDRTDGIGRGNIYHVWSPFFTCCDGFFTRSTNGGESFLPPLNIPIELFWGTIAVGQDGAVYVSGIEIGGTPAIARSSTAQNPQALPFFELTTSVDLNGLLSSGLPPNPGGLAGQVIVATAASPKTLAGNVYVLASVDPPGSDPLDVMFTRSTDGGVSWSKPVRVNDDPESIVSWQWFGTMSVAPNGRIDVIWNDTRNSGKANISELFYASSTDEGDTWTTNEILSPAFDSYLGWPQQEKLGDYYDMVSDDVGAHLAWAATFNGEQDVYYLRIGDYDCNGNSIGDADDLLDGASEDCNENGIPDECELAAGTLSDVDGNGVADECECLFDLNGNGAVDTVDLLDLLGAWGTEPGGPPDFDGGGVGTTDLLLMFASWGRCL